MSVRVCSFPVYVCARVQEFSGVCLCPAGHPTVTCLCPCPPSQSLGVFYSPDSTALGGLQLLNCFQWFCLDLVFFISVSYFSF